MMMPFVIGRPSSTRALEHALVKDKRIFLAAQHDAAIDDPQLSDIFTMGCVANIVQSLKLPDGNVKALIEAVDRARAVEWQEGEDFRRAVVQVVAKQQETAVDGKAVMSRAVPLFERYGKLSNDLHYDAMIAAVRVESPSKMADTIAAHLSITVAEKQELLETTDAIERLSRIAVILEREVVLLERDRRIESRVRKHIREKHIRNRNRIRKQIIQSEIDDLTLLLGKGGTPEEERARIREELKQLGAMATMTPLRRRRLKGRRTRETLQILPRAASGDRPEDAVPPREQQAPQPKHADDERMAGVTHSSAAPPQIIRSALWYGFLGGVLGALLVVGLKWLLAG
jgi:ATP-dependent Lon protease